MSFQTGKMNHGAGGKKLCPAASEGLRLQQMLSVIGLRKQMKIEQAEAMGLCKNACGYAEKGVCAYHKFPSHNYRGVKVGYCALTDSEAKEMMKEYGLSGGKKR